MLELVHSHLVSLAAACCAGEHWAEDDTAFSIKRLGRAAATSAIKEVRLVVFLEGVGIAKRRGECYVEITVDSRIERHQGLHIGILEGVDRSVRGENFAKEVKVRLDASVA